MPDREAARAGAPRQPSVYELAILQEAPRMLGMLDRQAGSRTAGCADRTYWAWKFTDFAGSRFQECACVLSQLYTRPFAGNVFHQNDALLGWIELALDWWRHAQHPDGSFDEAYPFERSLAATAFTAFYVSEAVAELGPRLGEARRGATVKTLARAGRWLIENDETHGFLSNHLAAAAAALRNIHELTGEERFAARARHFIDKVLDRQSAEGWYLEYGGADPGYQTHGSFYLARIWQKTQDPRLLASLGRAVAFQAHFVHPDGSLGGEYTSRNTQTYYPAAFEMLAGADGNASWIAETQRHHVMSGRVADLRSVDPYNYFVFLNNFAFAARALAETAALPPRAPEVEGGSLWLPECGLLKVRRRRYDAFVGTKKGGVLKVFDRERRALVFADCGYVGSTKTGAAATTQQEGGSAAVHVDAAEVQIAGGIFMVSRPVMTPMRFGAFRAFMASVGRFRAIASWIKSLLVKVLITKKAELDVRFARTIRFDEQGVRVEDRLVGAGGRRIEALTWTPSFTTIHMGSSRYFVEHELSPQRGDAPAEQVAAGATIERGVTFARGVSLPAEPR
jgi:hypothetical protein